MGGAKVKSGDLSDGQVAEALNGGNLTFAVSGDGNVTVNDENVIFPDVIATNGVVHVVDGVLVPPTIDLPAFLKKCAPKTASPTVTSATKAPTVTPATKAPIKDIHDSDDSHDSHDSHDHDSAASASNSFVGMFV